jgi:hypothetical protein
MTTVQTAHETGISYTMDQSILTKHVNAASVCEICANNSDGGPDGHQELFE